VPHQIIRSWYTLAVDRWAVTFGTARKGLDGGGAPRPILAVLIVRENVCDKTKKGKKSRFLDFEKKEKRKSNDL